MRIVDEDVDEDEDEVLETSVPWPDCADGLAVESGWCWMEGTLDGVG